MADSLAVGCGLLLILIILIDAWETIVLPRRVTRRRACRGSSFGWVGMPGLRSVAACVQPKIPKAPACAIAF